MSKLSHDLDWQAFQYVSGELSGADHEAFENRLAEDFEACEAVARVVETLEATAVTFAEQPTTVVAAQPVFGQLGAGRWIAVLTTIACLFTVAAMLSTKPDRASDDDIANDNGDHTPFSDSVVDAWVDASMDSDDGFGAGWLNSDNDESVEPLELMAWNDDALSSADDASLVPEWMVIAVKDASAMSDDVDPDHSEHN